MTIAILDQRIIDNDNGTFRTAYIWITDGVTPLYYVKGSLSAEGDLQTLLNGMEATLYAEAQVSGRAPTPVETAEADFQIYLTNNPNAKLIFTATSPDLETATNNLIDASFPLLTAAQKNRWKRALIVGELLDRIQVAGQ